MFKPTFRFFSVHFFFLPSLIQPQHPPRNFFLGRFCGCLHRKSVIFTISVYTILSYIYKIKSSAIFVKSKLFCCSVSVIVTSWRNPSVCALRHSHLPFQGRLWLFFSCSLLTSSSFIMRYISLINLSYSSLIFCFEYFPPSG